LRSPSWPSPECSSGIRPKIANVHSCMTKSKLHSREVIRKSSSSQKCRNFCRLLSSTKKNKLFYVLRFDSFHDDFIVATHHVSHWVVYDIIAETLCRTRLTKIGWLFSRKNLKCLAAMKSISWTCRKTRLVSIATGSF
jgi:hypothetical protein